MNESFSRRASSSNSLSPIFSFAALRKPSVDKHSRSNSHAQTPLLSPEFPEQEIDMQDLSPRASSDEGMGGRRGEGMGERRVERSPDASFYRDRNYNQNQASSQYPKVQARNHSLGSQIKNGGVRRGGGGGGGERGTYKPTYPPSAIHPFPNPPSSYHDDSPYQDHYEHEGNGHTPTTSSLSPHSYGIGRSPERSRHGGREGREGRKIQFSAPPPPIASSVVFTQMGSRGQVGGGGGGGNAKSYTSSRSGSISRSTIGGRGIGVGGGGSNEALLLLQRRERALQTELQTLLDAQSHGLSAGLGGPSDDTSTSYGGGSSDGTRTPTLSTHSPSAPRSASGKWQGHHGVIPVRQPKKKPLSLRAARRGLGRDMLALDEVKAEQEIILSEEISRREEILSRISSWELQIQELKSKIDALGQGDEGDGVESWRREQKLVNEEIRELEDRLLQLHTRKKYLSSKINEGVNRRESSVSGFKGALKEVEGEVGQWLARPGIIRCALILEEEEGIETLPAGRRTLGLAKDWYSRELSALTHLREQVIKEKQALDEGRKLWEDCVKLITGFENELREQMEMFGKEGGGGPDIGVLERQVERMRGVGERLEEWEGVCEGKGWRLLVVAVGAECAAIREGEEVLKGVLEQIRPRNSPSHSISHSAFLSKKSSSGLSEVDLNGEDPFGDVDGTARESVLEGLSKESSFRTAEEHILSSKSGSASEDLHGLHTSIHELDEEHREAEKVRESLERELSFGSGNGNGGLREQGEENGTEESEDEGPDLEGLMVDRRHRHEHQQEFDGNVS